MRLVSNGTKVKRTITLLQEELRSHLKLHLQNNSHKLFGKEIKVKRSASVSKVILSMHGIANLVMFQMMQLLSKKMYLKQEIPNYASKILLINAIIRNKLTNIMI